MALPYVWLITRYFRRLFAERRARPGDDLISALVQAEDGGDRLDQDELFGIAMLLLVAGYETTTHLIGSAALALLQHPDQRARSVSEPGLAVSGHVEARNSGLRSRPACGSPLPWCPRSLMG